MKIYVYDISDFPNQKVNLDRLIKEIRESPITIALDYISNNSSFINIYFKAVLSSEEKIILNNIVANHSGEPLPESFPIVRTEILTESLKFVETGDTTQGFFSAESIILDISTGELEKNVNISWKIDIALMSAVLSISESMIGDEMIVEVGPNTLIGALTQPLNIGDSSIYVSDTVIQYLKKGYYVSLYQPDNDGIELGRVISINDHNVVFDGIADVSANTGSYLSMCAKVIPYVYFNNNSLLEIGKDIPTGQKIPAGIPIRIKYKNNNGIAKKISFFIEYLY